MLKKSTNRDRLVVFCRTLTWVAVARPLPQLLLRENSKVNNRSRMTTGSCIVVGDQCLQRRRLFHDRLRVVVTRACSLWRTTAGRQAQFRQAQLEEV